MPITRLLLVATALFATPHLAASAGDPALIDDCPGASVYSQPPSDVQAAPGFSEEADGQLRTYDNFSGVTGPITGIVWWGGATNNGECARSPNNFEIGFFEDNGGQPGDLITTETATAATTSTGFAGPLGTILRHDVTFQTPVNLKSGWVSVYGVDVASCFFYWANSANGDDLAYNNGIGSLSTDFAFCLIGDGSVFASGACAPESSFGQPLADALSNPGFSDDGDGLRAYDNFTGLADPVAGVVWWGGGTSGGNNCVRNADYEISFYEENGGQPGTLVASETVTATVSPTGDISPLGSLYRHEATLSVPVDIASGWISVYGVSFAGCYFYWANGTGGDGNAYSSGNGSIGADFAFCLVTEDGIHTSDQDGNNAISLSELLRVIQFFNSSGYGCELGTEDGYNPNDPDVDCAPHDSDYNPQDWEITLSELLRLIQFFNSGGYTYCPGEDPATEDGFCPGGA